ncbi:uncharacterized protein F5Z01DRAFT_753116 [Emericellopsis atlantica]|uniref:Uncharacterized protein n=1 Tax=Emericellopsis atlantica TaxID=2614577 RepID=A0A9P7ZF72_9HYPO|nr:uncharacterized protein F5Z01DRAFT_753116 [Emericellopsis atlantica]KAG9250974.1 hypothetical protein F5Z01DRAFT_753116 [Emericellopsis atlantica]
MGPSDNKLSHVLLEPYCILCRNHAQFSRETVTKPENPVAPEPWEKVVMCFFSTEPTTEPTGADGGGEQIFRFKTDTPRGSDTEQEFIHGERPVDFDDEGIRAILQQAKLMLCYGCSDCDLERTANIVHIPCLQAARSKIPRLSVRQLCDMAWLLRPMLAWYNAGQVFPRQNPITRLPRDSDISSTELGSFLRDMRAKLPLDIERLICDKIPHGLFSSLSGCLQTISSLEKNGWLEDGVRARKSLFTLMPFENTPSPKSIGCDVVNILTENYIARITVNESVQSSQQSIQLLNRPMEGVQYAIGMYGMLALRICYTDKAVSAWLGEPPRKWIRFIRGSDLSKLEARSDGHRLLSLVFRSDEKAGEEDGASESEENKSTAFWEHAPTPGIEDKAVLIDFSMRTAAIRGNPGARFLRNITLPVADGKPHSITCFCHFAGTDSIQIDGDTNSRIGDPLSYSSPVTFYLQPDEVVDSVYGLMRGSGFADFPCPTPFALMRTTLGRYLCFSPYFLGPSDEFPSAVLLYGNESTHRATGLFFDALNSYISVPFYDDISPSMGVIQEPRSRDMTSPPETPISLCHSLPHIWKDEVSTVNPSGAIFSKAALAGVQEIVQQKEGDRVRGLRARFQDDTIRVLGAWDPSKSPDAFNTIFSADSDVKLESITFVMGQNQGRYSYMHQVVREIVVNRGCEMDQANVFTWERLDEEVCWYFYYNEDDVCYWEGKEFTPRIEPCKEIRYQIE